MKNASIGVHNPANVVLLEAYLEGLPLVLDFAANGVIASEKRRENDYDLVLMDIQMPLMDSIRRYGQSAHGKKPTGGSRSPSLP